MNTSSSQRVRTLRIIDTRVPSHEEISVRAYALWEDRGRPANRAEAFWFEAESQLLAAEQERVTVHFGDRAVAEDVGGRLRRYGLKITSPE